ncbi:hypothetical protein AGLY_001476 [Aphis glycines]|uniref:Uncharacterized protein n=1 Tax=Aphis glycines TaxID=307491 RepID=A0A6G0U5R9_APHGL|nr:hypothetical protein AGLY_001476 [Aphis glycines]
MKQDLDNIKKMYSMNHSNNIQIELISNENEVTPSTEFLNVLPISTCKTNQSQLEPNSYLSEVFPVGVYYGRAKPSDSNDFLTDFISEEKQLIVNGIILNGICKKVSIKSFCMQCSSKSIFTNNQRLFRFFFLHLVCPRRTHDTYINILYEEHHIGEMSRLVELPGLDLVHSFSLDYMHLYGALDNSSAFVFENFMKELKSKVRKHDKPLEQIINRYTEVYNKIPTSILQNPKP